MGTRSDVVKKIDSFFDQLSNPLAVEELKNGWTKENQKVVLEFFKGLRERVLNGEHVENIQVSRRLDAWGIVEGALLEFAEGVGQDVENLEKK